MGRRSATDAVVHTMHGSRFTSFVAPAFGDRRLCAWRLDVPAGTSGAPHVVSDEEVLLILDGVLTVAVNGVEETCRSGDVVVVPAGASFRVDTGDDAASAWVTTSVGLEAVTADGQRISPPWVR